jgi:hypothetical protein
VKGQWLGEGEPLWRWLAVCAEASAAWCVVVAKPGREFRAAAELALAGWSTYVPVQTNWVGSPRGGKGRRRRNVPLFARYLFAACEAGGDIAAPASIEDIVDVRRRSDGGSCVRRVLMARLMVAEASHAFDETWEAPRSDKRRWACGQSVKVRAGVMRGVDALIVKVLSERRVVARFPLWAEAGEGEAVFETADLEPLAPKKAA